MIHIEHRRFYKRRRATKKNGKRYPYFRTKETSEILQLLQRTSDNRHGRN